MHDTPYCTYLSATSATPSATDLMSNEPQGDVEITSADCIPQSSLDLHLFGAQGTMVS